MNSTQKSATARVPLSWIDDQAGYQCPSCALYVALPASAWATCPRCPSVPIEEVVTYALGNAGFDETDAGNAVEAIRPLLDSLGRASLR